MSRLTDIIDAFTNRKDHHMTTQRPDEEPEEELPDEERELPDEEEETQS